eukprot:9487015-Pyramimonas_sp.AAC.1
MHAGAALGSGQPRGTRHGNARWAPDQACLHDCQDPPFHPRHEALPCHGDTRKEWRPDSRDIRISNTGNAWEPGARLQTTLGQDMCSRHPW